MLRFNTRDVKPKLYSVAVLSAFALLCFAITFHAVFNIFVNQTGAAFWIGSMIPSTMVLVYLIFFRKRISPS